MRHAAELFRDAGGGLAVVEVVYGQKHRRKTVFFPGVSRRSGKNSCLFVKARPETQGKADVFPVRGRSGGLERRVDLRVRGGGQGQRRVRGQDDLRLRHTEARELLDAVRLAESYGVDAGVEHLPRLGNAARALNGADAAAVHHDFAAEALGRAQREEVVPEAPAAGDVLNETAAAVDVERPAPHDGKKARKVEGVHRREPEPGRGARGVAGHDRNGHERVNGAQLCYDGVEYGLVAGVAHAVGAADHNAAATVSLAVEYLLVNGPLLAAGGLYGKFPRRALVHGAAQAAAELRVSRKGGEPLGERFPVAGGEEIACLAVLNEPRDPADGGGHGGQGVCCALSDGVGEGLREGAERVYVERGVKLLHVVQPAREADGVARAELPCQGLERRTLRALARDDEPQLRVRFSCLGKAAHERGEVLDGVEPRRRADDYAVRIDLGAHALAERGTVQPLGLTREVEAVIYGEGRLPGKAAGDEQVAHRVRDADVVFDAPEREDVEHPVGCGRGGAAHVVEAVVAVHRADHGSAAGRAQYRAGQVGPGAVRVHEFEALLGYHTAHLAERGEESALAHSRLDAELRGLAGKGPVPEADERDIHAAREVFEQRVDVGLGSARVAAAYQMYNFQGHAPC